MSIKSLAIGITIGGAVQASLGRAYKTVRERQIGLSKALKDTSAQKKAASEYIKYKQTLGQLKAKQAQLTKSSPRLAEGIADVERRFKKAEKAAQKYGLKLSKITQEEKRLSHELEHAKSRQKIANGLQHNQNIRANAKGRVFGMIGMAYSVAAPISIAVDYEQVIAKLGAITQSTKPQIKQLSKTAQMLGRTTQFSASEASEAMTFLGMAGFKTNQILQATPSLLDLAQASGSDLGQTADIASNILSGFSLKADQMGRVGDVLSKTFTSSNVTLEMLGETMKYVAPAAASAGASMEEVAGMAGMLGNVGIQGSQAGTALRMAFIRLAKPPKVAQDAIEQLGLSIKDSAGNMRSMPDILHDIALKTKNLGNADKLALMTKIFGAEASSAMIELSKQAGNGALDAYIKKLHQAHGITKKMAKQMGETTHGALLRLKSAFESVAITVGSLVLPAIAWGADKLAYLASKVGELGQAFPALTTGLVGVVGGLVGLKLAAFAGKVAFSFISDGVLIARLALGGLLSVFPKIITGVRAISLALMANPIGLIIGGIALAAGLIIFYWKPIKAFFSDLWEGVKSKFHAFSNWVSGWGKKLGSIIKKVFENSPIGLIIKAGKSISSWWQGDSAKAPATAPAKIGQTAQAQALLHKTDTTFNYQPKQIPPISDRQNVKHTTIHSSPTFQITQQSGESEESLTDKIMQAFQNYYARLETDV